MVEAVQYQDDKQWSCPQSQPWILPQRTSGKTGQGLAAEISYGAAGDHGGGGGGGACLDSAQHCSHGAYISLPSIIRATLIICPAPLLSEWL